MRDLNNRYMSKKSNQHKGSIKAHVLFFVLQRLKFEIAEVMTEIEHLTCMGETYVHLTTSYPLLVLDY